jgi:hypothetical protein
VQTKTTLRIAALVAAVPLLAPPAALARHAAVRRIDLRLPAPGARTPAAAFTALKPIRVAGGFSLVGLHWRGAATVRLQVRTALGAGAFGPWAPLVRSQPVTHLEARPRRELMSDPVWAGPSDRLQVRFRGVLTRLVAVVVDPGPNPTLVPLRAAAPRAAAAAGPPVRPDIVPRAQWGANESLRRGAVRIAPRLLAAFIHQTDTPNGYKPADAPSTVRAIYLYQVQGGGYTDVSFNFFVDAFGRIYEGRFGGIGQNVVGAGTAGFNLGGTSIALIGNFFDTAPTGPALTALRNLLAWRLDVGHVRPLGKVRMTSGGNPRFKAGTKVTVNTISPFSAVANTASPGAAVIARLPQLRQAVAAVGGLRIWNPTLQPATIVTTSRGIQPIRFTAALSRLASWRVVISTASGAALAVRSGTGAAVDAVWNGAIASGGSLPPAASLRWRIEAGSGSGAARPAAGSFDGSGAPSGGTETSTTSSPAISAPKAVPTVISPNGDRVADTGALTWKQSAAATVEVDVQTATGSAVRILQPPVNLAAGAHSVPWNGTDAAGRVAPSNHYRYALKVQLPGQPTFTTITVPVDVRAGGSGLKLTPIVLSPNGDGTDDVATVGITRLERGDVTLRVRAGRRVAATIASAFDLPAGFVFGTQWLGGGLPDGAYLLEALVPGNGGLLTMRQSFKIDTTAPRMPNLVVSPARRWFLLAFRLSERAHLELRVGTRLILAGTFKPGKVRIRAFKRRLGTARRVTLVAVDAGGNTRRRSIGLK